MIVVSDTTPLITLMKIGHLDLLEKNLWRKNIFEAEIIEIVEYLRSVCLINRHYLRKYGREIGLVKPDICHIEGKKGGMEHDEK